jgi:hypothetical protein
VPIAIAKNAIRIVALCLLAVHVDPAFLVGRLHTDGGVAFFLLALAMLAPVLALLGYLEGSRRRFAAAARLDPAPVSRVDQDHHQQTASTSRAIL